MRLTDIPEYLRKILFICLFAWISFFPEPVQGKYWVYTVIFLAVFLLILILNKNYPRLLFSFKDWPVWLLIICLFSGTILAENKNIAWAAYFHLGIPLFFLFYLGKGLLARDENKDMLSVVICAGSLIVAVIGLLEFYLAKNILYENFLINGFYERYKFAGRPMSTQFNPVILGSYLLGCFPFGLILLKNKLLYLRLLAVVSLLISAFVIILTFSRGVFLGFMVMVCFYLWHEHKAKLLGAFVLLSAAVIIFCSFQINDNLKRFGFQRFIAGSSDSILSEYRFQRIKMASRMLQEHPFFGVGLNHFRIKFGEYCNKDNINEAYEFRIPDNMYLTFLAETGLIGISGFLLFIVFLLKAGLKEVKKQSTVSRQILLVSLTSLVGLLVNMGAYDLFYWNNPFMLFCLICGFIASPRKIQR